MSLRCKITAVPRLLIILGFSTAVGLAQEVRSRPVGYLVQAVPAGQTRSFSVPFDADTSSLPNAVGALTGVGADYLENSAASWTAGAFSDAAAPYFVRLTSGPQAGRTFRITPPANTATRLYVADDGVGLAALGLTTGTDGTRFEIIPGDTLGSFWGTTTPTDTLVVQGAADVTQADIVHVWGGASWLNFYYNTAWQRWARDSDGQADPSRNNYPLRADRGIMITRRGGTPLELVVIGRVLNTPQQAFHAREENALTFLATMQTADVTLGALALQDGTRSQGWRGSGDPTTADSLFVWSGASWHNFFYNNVVGHWQRVDDSTDRDSYLITAGTPVFVQRRAAGATAADKTISFPAPGS